MNRMVMSGLLLFVCVVAGAQSPAAPEKGRSAAAKEAKTEEEVKTLRLDAAPLLELKKKHGAAMSAIKRAQVAERKQVRSQMSSGALKKDNKAMSDLLAKHREAMQKQRSANKVELDAFNKKNPKAEKAYKDLLYDGLPLAEPADKKEAAGKK